MAHYTVIWLPKPGFDIHKGSGSMHIVFDLSCSRYTNQPPNRINAFGPMPHWAKRCRQRTAWWLHHNRHCRPSKQRCANQCENDSKTKPQKISMLLPACKTKINKGSKAAILLLHWHLTLNDLWRTILKEETIEVKVEKRLSRMVGPQFPTRKNGFDAVNQWGFEEERTNSLRFHVSNMFQYYRTNHSSYHPSHLETFPILLILLLLLIIVLIPYLVFWISIDGVQ